MSFYFLRCSGCTRRWDGVLLLPPHPPVAQRPEPSIAAGPRVPPPLSDLSPAVDTPRPLRLRALPAYKHRILTLSTLTCTQKYLITVQNLKPNHH